jgi:acetyl-CoA synthetase
MQRDIDRANVTQLGHELGLHSYAELHHWSITDRPAYWRRVMERLNIRLTKPYEQVLDATHPTRPRWLVGAQMNIVDSCFQADPLATAIIESDGVTPLRRVTYGELRSMVARVAGAIAARGLGPGGGVAIVMPMTTEAVAAYLGIIAAGAAVVSIPESFSAEEIAGRLRIADASLVVTQDVIHRGDKRLRLYDKFRDAIDIPVVVFSNDPAFAVAKDNDVTWQSFLGNDTRLRSVARCPQDSINILFSSGTTGDPKAIPWDHTTAIKAAADAHFHQDIHSGDVLCWPTSLGWMMGPWLIFAATINRAAIALYTQAPGHRAFGKFVQDASVTMLGSVPSMVRAWRLSHCMDGLDWSRIRAFSSSGECSNPNEMLFLMQLAGSRPVIEYCGGTEIGGAYLTGTVVQPCIPSAFSTPALGIDVVVLDESGQPAETGEAFLIGASMGLSTRLRNRDHEQVYFSETPVHHGTPLRRHGDEVQKLPDGYFRMIGRCDDTMNLGGIKVGCAEIERVLNGVEGVMETAAVALPPPGGGPSRLVVFAVAAQNLSPEKLKGALSTAIRQKLNPLFHLDEVRIVPSLPRTPSNKILRRELRASIGK